MSAVFQGQKNGLERRKFPRILACCPVRFAESSGQIDEGWGVAEMKDYSATGMRMVCDKTLLRDTKIILQVLPEKNTRVPQLFAEGVVVRCEINNDHRFEIACRFTRVKRKRV